MSENPDPAIFPDLTPQADTAEPACGYIEDEESGSKGSEPCGRSGTWHIAWRLASELGGAQAAFVCDVHMEAVARQFVFADRHEVGPSCGMPGTLWFRSWMGKAECRVVA
ncbi:hypothetical protein ACF1A9_28665 [Streptomyces sp. NPDC014872]|uniref:hypothetical protein n=1 Tax=Streptomyces sp. NPDC014872 TaxID=3364926 RepID=UPI0036FCA4B7